MSLQFPLPPPRPDMSKEEMFLLLEAWQRLITKWFYKVYDLGANLTLDSSNQISADDQGVITDHGLLDAASLLDDDHPQYHLASDLVSENTALGGTLIGFDDTGGVTDATDINDIINRILADIGYAEAVVGTGELVFSDSDNSHHLSAVA